MIGTRLISASLSPNTQKDDVFLALRLLFEPTRWMTGNSRLKVEKWFGTFFHNPQVITFNSGRSALFAILRAFGIGIGDEVLVQAFTCVAVPNSVLWTGARPIYVDIDATLNMDPADAVAKISKHTRAVIIQHTFGTPADLEKILAVAKKYNLLVIEDCAHSLGATYRGRKVGTFGDAACFSFGRDKVISSVFGGLALISRSRKEAWTRLKKLHNRLPNPGGFWLMQQLFHPVAFSIILPMYRLGLGKALLVVLQKLGLLGFPVYAEEKESHRPTAFPRKYPNGLAILLVNQLKKLERFNTKRRARATWYHQQLSHNDMFTLPGVSKGSIAMRYPLIVNGEPKVLIEKAKKHGVLLGNWYHNIIDPTGVKFPNVFYVSGSCPKAEYAANHIINLPTNISEKDALRVIKVLM